MSFCYVIINESAEARIKAHALLEGSMNDQMSLVIILHIDGLPCHIVVIPDYHVTVTCMRWPQKTSSVNCTDQ
jgi:hypothetical protein